MYRRATGIERGEESNSSIGGGVGSSAGVKTWSSVTSSQEGGGPERNFLGHQSPFFPQEFPKLAGGDVPIDGTQRSATDSQYGPGPSLRPQRACDHFSARRYALRRFSVDCSERVNCTALLPEVWLPCDGEVETAIEAEEPEAAFCEQELTEAMNALGATGVTYDDYVAVDAALVTSECQSIAEIVVNAVASEVGDRDDDDEHEPQDSVELADPSFGDAVAALDLLRRVRGVRNAPDEDGYQRPAIISEKDLKGFDEILQNDSQDGWAAAKGDIDYNAKLVFSDEEDGGGSSRGAASKGSDLVQVSESGKPVAMKGSEKGECRPSGPAGPKLPSNRSREPGWDASPGQQSAQQRAGREPAPTQASAYMDREERGRKAWGAPGSAELQPQPPPLSQQSQQTPPAQTAPVRQWPQSPQGAPPPAAAATPAPVPRATGAPPLDYLARGTPPTAATPPTALATAAFPAGRVGPPMPPQPTLSPASRTTFCDRFLILVEHSTRIAMEPRSFEKRFNTSHAFGKRKRKPPMARKRRRLTEDAQNSFTGPSSVHHPEDPNGEFNDRTVPSTSRTPLSCSDNYAAQMMEDVSSAPTCVEAPDAKCEGARSRTRDELADSRSDQRLPPPAKSAGVCPLSNSDLRCPLLSGSSP
ncbi:hypothetical protein HPB50_007684 [Hyalomma asiaticum]|uniref:Uncharacterized protein n=1 Tax=Hyalomma asiaticum TaxID=266040 RepID=A0ACB7TDM5_HYAAI|nr:hypothetical protein HPB50_007684 [Hyalomma asiaticum]